MGIFFQLDRFSSDQSQQTLDVSLMRMLIFCCFLAEPTSLAQKDIKWKLEKKNPFEIDRTQLRLKSSLIRLMCAWIRLWSDQPIRKRALIRPSPSESDLWSYYCALKPKSRPRNFGLIPHRTLHLVSSEVISPAWLPQHEFCEEHDSLSCLPEEWHILTPVRIFTSHTDGYK